MQGRCFSRADVARALDLKCRTTRVRALPTAPIEKATADQAAKAARVAKARLITAVKTPYKENGKVDIDAYDRHLDAQARNGVEGVIVGGTTGEGQLMSWDEHIMLIAHTANAFGDRLLVIGNTGSNSTREALHASEQGFIVGMDAALQINPYYGKTSPSGLLEHLTLALNEGPAIVYNVPSRTGQDIPDAVIDQIATHPCFIGVKECTGNARIARHQGQGVRCWSGNDDEAHDARWAHGGHGVVSVTSNIVPGLMSRLMLEQDDELNGRLQRLIGWLFCQPNPIPVNTAMAMCGLCKPVFRGPYIPLSREERERGVALLQDVQEHIPGCQGVEVLEGAVFSLVHKY
jgi:4-hydroxy-tetrahydrodipicolinate synthase